MLKASNVYSKIFFARRAFPLLVAELVEAEGACLPQAGMTGNVQICRCADVQM